MTSRTLQHEDYKVGWICALSTEMAASEALLDETHNSLAQDTIDHNSYTLGRIGVHNIVMACLPDGGTGTISAARVAGRMRGSFRSLRFGLMVGIGGGVPSEEKDIRLGDVVVSHPDLTSGGVIQYDFGKTVQGGRFVQTGTLNKPPEALRTALARLQAKHLKQDPGFTTYLLEMTAKYPKMAARFTHPGPENDILYHAMYDHPEGNKTCSQCDLTRRVWRKPRVSRDPVVHLGVIASGDQVMRHGATRERLRRDMKVDCFEMEAAGLMDDFPSLIIRGICDYADSHKNKAWQPYAAATAAAYAKELLDMIAGDAINATPVVPETTAHQGAEGKNDGRNDNNKGNKSKTGNFPEKCLVCGERCESLDALYRHLKVSRHGKEHNALKSKKPPSATVCRLCGKQCPQRDALYSHARDAGHDQRYILPPAQSGDLKEVQVRLDEGADIEVRDENYDTALHLAAKNGHVHIVRFLLDRGLENDTANRSQRTPLNYAAIEGHLLVVKLFIERGSLKVERTQPTSLAHAAENGRIEVAKLLLSNGADIEAKTWENRTPLDLAARAGQRDMVELLLDKGADFAPKSYDRRTHPIMPAAQAGHFEVVKVLLERGIDKSDYGNVVDAALHRAITGGNIYVVELLLDRGASVEGINNDGAPLRTAASHSQVEVVKMLFNRGAKVDNPNYNPRYKQDAAKAYVPNYGDDHMRKEVVELINQHRRR